MTRGRSLRRWLAADRARARRLRQERTFRNSAIWRIVAITVGVGWTTIGFALDAVDPFQLGLAALMVCRGVPLVWAGVRRWRAGGEFNLPGRAGPLLISPPPERRGD